LNDECGRELKAWLDMWKVQDVMRELNGLKKGELTVERVEREKFKYSGFLLVVQVQKLQQKLRAVIQLREPTIDDVLNTARNISIRAD